MTGKKGAAFQSSTSSLFSQKQKSSQSQGHDDAKKRHSSPEQKSAQSAGLHMVKKKVAVFLRFLLPQKQLSSSSSVSLKCDQSKEDISNIKESSSPSSEELRDEIEELNVVTETEEFEPHNIFRMRQRDLLRSLLSLVSRISVDYPESIVSFRSDQSKDKLLFFNGSSIPRVAQKRRSDRSLVDVDAKKRRTRDEDL